MEVERAVGVRSSIMKKYDLHDNSSDRKEKYYYYVR